MIRKVSYLFGFNREETLSLTFTQLFDYAMDGMYWSMEERGIECERPMSDMEEEEQKEREAKLKSIYYKKRKENNK